MRARIVHEHHALAETHGCRRLARGIPIAPVQRFRHLPVIEIEWVALREVESVLAALGTEPEPIFAAEDVHMRATMARTDRFPPNPAKARSVAAARRARQDAALVGRRDRHLRPARGVG